MEIRFTNKKLEALYTEGKSAKYKLDDRVLQAFFEVVAILEAAHDIYDLWSQPSLNFERLKGSPKGYSARLTKQYRLTMSVEWLNKEMTVGILGLEDISNHYGG